MMQKTKKIIFIASVFIFCISAFAPVFVGAVDTVSKDTAIVELENPIKGDIIDIRQIYGRALNIVLGILGSLALFVFIDGAWVWMTSLGNQEKVKKGMNAMVWAVVGILAIFASYGILNAFINTGLGAKGDLGTSTSEQTSTDSSSSGSTESGVCAIKYTATCSSKKNEKECNVDTVITGTKIQPCIFDKSTKTCKAKADLGCEGLPQDKCVKPCEFDPGTFGDECEVEAGTPNCNVSSEGKTKEDAMVECKKKPNCDWFESK